jgi:hypothetical protein
MTSTERKLRAEWRRIRSEHFDRLAGCSFKVNGRFKRRLGVCRSRRSDGAPVSVEVAAALMAPGLEQQAFDTLYHEAAHALAGHAAGHGPEWKAWCRKLGATPERLASMTTEERQIMETVNRAKWTVTCNGGCPGAIQRHRFNARAICAKCSSGLTWTDNATGRRRRTVAVSVDDFFNW